MRGIAFISIVFTVIAPAAVRAEAAKIAVLPTHFDASAKGKIPQSVFEEALLGATQNASHAKVIGADDLSAILGLEKQRDLLGCDELTCMAEIAGALDVQTILSAKVAYLDSQWAITIKLINVAGAPEVLARVTEFVTGGPSDLLKALPNFAEGLFVTAARNNQTNDSQRANLYDETLPTEQPQPTGSDAKSKQEIGLFIFEFAGGLTVMEPRYDQLGGDVAIGIGLRGPIAGLLSWRARIGFEFMFDSDSNTFGAIAAEAGIRFRPFAGTFSLGIGGFSAPIFALSLTSYGSEKYPSATFAFGGVADLMWAYGDNDENEIGVRGRFSPIETMGEMSVSLCLGWGL